MSTAYVLADASANARVASNESGAGDATLSRTAVIALTANPVANDTYDVFKLPKGAVVTHASIRSIGVDTNSSATLAAKLGTAANGTDSASLAGLVAVTTATNTTGALNGQGGIDPTLSKAYYQATTTVRLTFTAVAATFVAGNVAVTVTYKTPGLPTS